MKLGDVLLLIFYVVYTFMCVTIGVLALMVIVGVR